MFREHAVAVLAFNREHGRANLSLSRLDRYKPNSATTESRRQDRGLKASCRAVNAQRLACDPTPAVGDIRKQFPRRYATKDHRRGAKAVRFSTEVMTSGQVASPSDHRTTRSDSRLRAQRRVWR